MKSIHLNRTLLSSLIAGLFCSSGSPAANVAWTLAGDGFWDASGNWTALPAAGDNVTIDIAGLRTITYRTGTTSIGSLTVTNNRFVQTAGTLTVTGAYNNTGSGGTTLAGGVLRLNGASSLNTLSMGSGTLSGSGAVTVGSLAFGGGTMGESGQGGGTTTVTGAATFDGTSTQTIAYGRTLNLNGGATWTSSTQGYLNIYSGGQGTSTVNIGSGSTFADQGTTLANQTRYLGASSDGVVNNAGTYLRSGNGSTEVSASFNNAGTLQVNSGKFNLSNGATSTGAILVGASGTLGFAGGTANLTGGSLTNNGTLMVSGGTANLNAGLSYSGNGAITVSGGLLNSAVATVLTPASLSLSGGTARFGGGANTGSLNMTGGILSGNVTAGTLAFSGGTMGESGQGGGTTTISGAATIDGTGQQSLYYGRTLNLNGGATWTSSNQGYLNIYSGGQGTSTVNIASGTTFADQGTLLANQTRYLGASSDGVVNNAGTYTRGGNGTTEVNASFNNSGTLQVDSGRLNLSNGGTGTGAIVIATGATLGFGGGTTSLTGGSLTNNGTLAVTSGTINLNAGVTVSGAGAVNVSGGLLNSAVATTLAPGSLSLGGGTARFAGPVNAGSLTMTGGILSGAGAVTAGTLAFSGGIMGESGQGGGTTTITGAATLDGVGQQSLYYGRTLNLNGGATWTSSTQGYLNIYSGGQGTSTVNIASGTTFADQGNLLAGQTRYLGASGDGAVNNAGTYIRSGNGATDVAARFNNTGTLQVNSGRLNLNNVSTSTGAIVVGAGATLGFGGSTINLTGGSLTNNGTLAVTSGTINLNAGVTVSGAGAVNVSGGLLNSAVATTLAPGSLSLGGGTARFAGPVNAGSLTMTGGTLSGAGAVTAGTLAFSGGIMGESGQGGGTTTITGAATIDGVGQQSLYYGRTLNLNGGATWTSSNQGYLNIYSGGQGTSTVNIASGTTFADQGTLLANQVRYFGVSGDGAINNAGTYTRGGNGTTEVSAAFNNTGTVQVDSGRLSLNGGGTGTGATAIASGATLGIGGGTLNLNGGSLANNGTLVVTGGRLNLNAGISYTGGGAVAVSGGVLNSALGTTIAPASLNLTGGTARFAGAVNPATLTMSNSAVLSGTGTVTVGALVLNGGTMGESGFPGGVTTVTGSAVIDGTAAQSIVYGRTLNLNGATNWTSGQGYINIYPAGLGTTAVNIGSGATFTDQGLAAANQSRNLGLNGGGEFNVAGTYARNGVGTTIVNAAFNNTGTVRVNSGILNLSAGGTSSGAMEVLSGATTRFTGGTYSLAGGTLNNSGTAEVNSGTLAISAPVLTSGNGNLLVSGGTLRMLSGASIAPSNLTMTGGTLDGPGSLTAGTLAFNSGTMGSSGQAGGVTTITGAATIDGASSQSIYYGHTLNLNGGATWTNSSSGSLSLYMGGAAAPVLNIGSGSTFSDLGTVSASQVRSLGTGGGGLLNNAGTYARSGNGTTTVGAIFNNTGTVQVDSGSMVFNAGGSNSGTLATAAGAAVRFLNGTFNIGGGTLANAGTMQVSGATVTVSAPVANTGNGSLVVSGGTLRMLSGSSMSPGNLTMSGGTLDGPGSLSAGTLAFNSGTMGSSGQAGGVTTITGAATIDGASNQYLYYGHTLNLNGATTWTNGGTGSLAMYAGGVGNPHLNIGSGATFSDLGTASAGQTRALGVYGDGVIGNAGTFVRSGLGTTAVAAAFNNTGTVQADGGILSLNQGGSSSGTLATTAGATLRFGGGTFNIGGGTFANSGTTQVSSGTVNVSAPVSSSGNGSLAVSGGTLRMLSGSSIASGNLTMSGGTLDGPGSLSAGTLAFNSGTMGSSGQAGGVTTITGAATIDGASNQYLYYGHTLNLNGATTWTNGGTGSLALYAGGVGNPHLNIGSGATFSDLGTATAGQTRALGVYGDGVIGNAGTYARSGLGTTAVAAAFNNTGTVQADGGILSLNQGGSSSGTLATTAGATLRFGGGTFNIGGGTFANSGTAQVSGGTVNVSAPVSSSGNGSLAVSSGTLRMLSGSSIASGNLTMSGGTLDGPGSLSAGTLAFNSGTMGSSGQAGGVTTITGAATIDGAANQYLYYGHTLNLNGATTWTNGGTGAFALYAGGVGNPHLNIGSGATFSDLGTASAGQTRSLGVYGDGVISNAGTYARSGNGTTTVAAGFTNTGLVDVSGGTMSFLNNVGGLQGTGTLQTSGSGAITIAGPVTTGSLILGSTAATNLNIAGNNITVAGDYMNANTGSGNAYNRHAGVSGSGQILASGGAALTVSGAQVSNGATATPTLTIGNVHVGTTAFNYQVGNAGAGSALRGAVQTGVNGGNITDARLGGAGATAGNFGPVAAGASSGAMAVNFTVGSAGVYANTAGQRVNLISNFDNVSSKLLTINASGAAYNLAQGAVTPTSISLGNAREGGAFSGVQALTVQNIAPGGSFTEKLNASIGAVTGGATGNGNVSLLAAGASDTTSMQVALSNGGGGAKTGTVTINFVSDGAGTSGLGQTVLASQTVTLTGNVYRLAAASAAAPNPVSFGNVHVGDVATRALSISNTAAADGSSEKLNATLGGASGAATVGGAGVSLLAAGATDSTGLVLGMNTGSAGHKTGSAAISLASDGAGTSGFAALGIGTQTVTLSGDVYRLASAGAAAPNPVVVANQRIGGAATAAVTIGNTAAADGYSESLRASFGGATAGVSASGATGAIAAGGSNGTSLLAGVDTSSAGHKSGSATISLVSDGAGTSGLGSTALAGQGVTISGDVYRVAAASMATPAAINFGNLHVGAGASQAISIGNTAATDGFSEKLSVGLGAQSGAATFAGGVNQLAAGATSSSGMFVGLVTSTAGAKTGSATLNLYSDGAGTSGLSLLGIGSQAITVSGNVYNLAGANSIAPISFGNVHVGDTVSQALAITNTAAAGAFSEKLNASFGGVSDSRITTAGSISLLDAGASSNAMVVGLNTSAAGNVNGTATVLLASDGSGTSGLGITSLASQLVGVSGTITGGVYRLANPSAAAPNPVNFGNMRVGASADQAITIGNTAVNDGFSEKLNASIASNGAPVTAGGSFNLLAAQGSDSSSLHVGLNTATAGAKTGNATISLTSDGAGTSGLGQTALASQTVQVSGNVFNVAVGSASPSPIVIGNQRVGGSASQALTVANTAAPGLFSEALNASLATTGNAVGGGSVGNIAAGSSAALGVGVNTASAGAKSGTAVLSFQSDGTGSNGNSGLAAIGAGGQTISVSGNVYNAAVGTAAPSPIVFANRHVGDAASQALTVTNSAAPGLFSEALNASFSGGTGNASGSGAVAGLAAGASNGAGLSVALSTASAGARNGTVTLSYQTDGTGANGNSGLAAIGAGSQTITVSGNVYNLAGANAIAPVSFGNVHVGDTVSQALAITNTAAAGAFSEKLNASFGGTSDSRITTAGGISLLDAGATSTAMSVGLNTSAAGNVNGTATVLLASDGSGTSGLGLTSLASQLVGVSGTITGSVYRLASPSAAAPNPVNFGNLRVGAVAEQLVTIGNTAVNDGFSEKLNASIASNGAPVTAGGSFNLLAAQGSDSSSLHVGLNTATAGAKSGSATISLTSDGAGTSGLGQTALAAQNVLVSGNVYNVAVGAAAPSPIVLHQRVGDAASQALTVSNAAAPGAFSEALNAGFSGATGSAGGSGSLANLAAGASNSGAMRVGLDSSSAGAKSGTVTLSYQTDGTGSNGNSGLAAVAAGSQTITITGNVYSMAAAMVAPATIDFGTVHVGDVVAARAVSVTNTAALSALNDTLTGSFGGAAGPFTASGNLGSGVLAQATNGTSLLAGLSTASAGVFSGAGLVSLQSHDADLADVSLASTAVALMGTVNNYAMTELEYSAGSAAFSHSGAVYRLDFGTVAQGSGPRTAQLRVANGASGQADWLGGGFCLPGAPCATDNVLDFVFDGGFADFRDLGAGDITGPLGISFDTASLGAFTDELTLAAFGYNNSGYRNQFGDIRLYITGNVVARSGAVPEPGSLALGLLGLMLLWGARHKKYIALWRQQ